MTMCRKETQIAVAQIKELLLFRANDEPAAACCIAVFLLT